MGTDVATAWALRLGWTLGNRVPSRLFWPVVERFGDQAWRRRGKGLLRLEANLRRAVPGASEAELRELSRTAMQSNVRYWGEMFRLPRVDTGYLNEWVVTHNMDLVRDTLAEGRGVIAALPHMGNWDVAGAWACANGMPVTTVVERLEPDSLFHDFLRYREELGMEPIALTGDYSILPYLSQRLREGRFVCLLADRDLSRSGIAVPFLGETARMPVGPAVLAQRTGALLVPATTDYEGGHLHVRIHEPIQVRPGEEGVLAMVTDLADVFGAAIRAAPQDWHMMQRVFEADLDPRHAPVS